MSLSTAVVLNNTILGTSKYHYQACKDHTNHCHADVIENKDGISASRTPSASSIGVSEVIALNKHSDSSVALKSQKQENGHPHVHDKDAKRVSPPNKSSIDTIAEISM